MPQIYMHIYIHIYTYLFCIMYTILYICTYTPYIYTHHLNIYTIYRYKFIYIFTHAYI